MGTVRYEYDVITDYLPKVRKAIAANAKRGWRLMGPVIPTGDGYYIATMELEVEPTYREQG